MTTLFVGNLHKNITTEDLKENFLQYGKCQVYLKVYFQYLSKLNYRIIYMLLSITIP